MQKREEKIINIFIYAYHIVKNCIYHLEMLKGTSCITCNAKKKIIIKKVTDIKKGPFCNQLFNECTTKLFCLFFLAFKTDCWILKKNILYLCICIQFYSSFDTESRLCRDGKKEPGFVFLGFDLVLFCQLVFLDVFHEWLQPKGDSASFFDWKETKSETGMHFIL